VSNNPPSFVTHLRTKTTEFLTAWLHIWFRPNYPCDNQSGLRIQTTRGLNRLDIGVRIIVGAGFLAIIVRVIVAPIQTLSHSQTFMAALWAAVIIAAWFLLRRRIQLADRWLDAHNWQRRTILWTGHGLLTCVATLWAYALYQPFRGGWDVDTVVAAAREWAQTGTFTDPHPFANGNLDYFGSFPNNIGLLNLLRAIGIITGPQLFAAAVLVLCVLLSALTIMMCYDIVRRVSSAAQAMACAVVLWILIGFSPWICVPYTDTLGLVFPVAIIWLFTKVIAARSWLRRIALTATCGIVAGCGIQVKTTIAIGLIATCLTLFAVAVLSHKNWRSAAACFVILATVGLGSSHLLGALLRSALPDGTAQSQPFPLEYFVLTGLSQSGNGYGSFSASVTLLMQSVNTTAQRQELGREAIIHDLRELGPANYARFLYDKATWIYSDATFWAFGEGGTSPAAAFRNSDPMATLLQSLAFPSGSRHMAWMSFVQGLWVAVLSKLLAGLAQRAKTSFDVLGFCLITSIAGFTLYQLISEARPRYLFLYATVIIVSAFVLHPTAKVASNQERTVPDLGRTADTNQPADCRLPVPSQ